MSRMRHKSNVWFMLAALAFASCSGEPVTMAQSSVTVIRGGTALVGPELTPLEDPAIVVEAGRILALGPSSEVPTPEGATEISGAGLTLMPGFIDTHVHMGLEPREVAHGGVTTVEDLAWPRSSSGRWSIARASRVTQGAAHRCSWTDADRPKGYLPGPGGRHRERDSW